MPTVAVCIVSKVSTEYFVKSLILKKNHISNVTAPKLNTKQVNIDKFNRYRLAVLMHHARIRRPGLNTQSLLYLLYFTETPAARGVTSHTKVC